MFSCIYCAFDFIYQDFTGVPAVVDLACMRDAMNRLGGDSNKINPLVRQMQMLLISEFKIDI